jgi:hypothetical protein
MRFLGFGWPKFWDLWLLRTFNPSVPSIWTEGKEPISAMIRTKGKLPPFMLNRELVERSKHERDVFSISPPLPSTSLRTSFDIAQDRLRHRSGQASTMLRTGFDRSTGSRLRANGHFSLCAYHGISGLSQRLLTWNLRPHALGLIPVQCRPVRLGPPVPGGDDLTGGKPGPGGLSLAFFRNLT